MSDPSAEQNAMLERLAWEEGAMEKSERPHRLDGRVVVWFSCGAASAVAAKLAVQKYPDAHVVYCDLFYSEHPDNVRFFAAVQQWIGKEIEVIKSKKYANIEESFEPKGWKNGYMSGLAGAQCTREMKKVPRQDYQLPNDLHIFGLCADEQGRIQRFERNNPELEMEWILLDNFITHDECKRRIVRAGISLPVMYSLGFKNNNCIGCVKSQSPAYWSRVRRYFPDVFQRRAEQSRRIGCKLIKIKGIRTFLDELPSDLVDNDPEPDIECGVICIQEASDDLTN